MRLKTFSQRRPSLKLPAKPETAATRRSPPPEIWIQRVKAGSGARFIVPDESLAWRKGCL